MSGKVLKQKIEEALQEAGKFGNCDVQVKLMIVDTHVVSIVPIADVQFISLPTENQKILTLITPKKT